MELEHIANAVGRQQGEAVVTLLAIINTLRKQPGFDNSVFVSERVLKMG
jgi:hypothetical protein